MAYHYCAINKKYILFVKATPFLPYHRALGAKIAPFAGYQMPISYTGIIDEHVCVRQKVGIFDVSHMGEFIVRGSTALDLIQYITSNDAARLSPGKVQYSCLPNEQGGIIDDLLVYNLPDGAYMLVVNAANTEKDFAHISQQNEHFGAELIDVSERTGLLAVQGPLAADALQSLTDMDLRQMKYYTCAKGVFAGVPNVLVSATGYTGAGGFEVYFYNEHADTIWQAIMEAGEPYGIQPIGLAARDTLRLEKGFCLYGNDIDDTTTPLEAGLGWITKLKKNADFIAKALLIAQHAEGVKRELVGFVIDEKAIARAGYNILQPETGAVMGRVTSGTFSPSLQKSIFLGYVPTEYARENTIVAVQIRQKNVAARVVKLPFL